MLTFKYKNQNINILYIIGIIILSVTSPETLLAGGLLTFLATILIYTPIALMNIDRNIVPEHLLMFIFILLYFTSYIYLLKLKYNGWEKQHPASAGLF